MEEKKKINHLDINIWMIWLLIICYIGWRGYLSYVSAKTPDRPKTQSVAAIHNGTAEFHQDTIINNPAKERWNMFVEPYYDIRQNAKNGAGIKFGVRGECGLSDLLVWLKPKREVKETQTVGNATK